MLLSDDAGASWLWTCEQAATAMGYLYSLGPAPRSRLYGLSPVEGLSFSDDGTCTWQRAGGALTTAIASDYFVDRTNADRVLAIAATQDSGGSIGPQAVYASGDGGGTFGATPLYTAPASTNVVGIEIARTDPQVVYLAMYGYPGRHPSLVRSTDGGVSWTSTNVEPTLGANEFRILAVDSDDANLVYLRVIAPNREEVWITRDGGGTFEQALVIDSAALSAFARLASGTVLVGALVNLPGGGTNGTGYRSVDQGRTFVPWSLCPQPHIVGLAERGGVLYIAGKNYSDGWALATSTDEGVTLTPLSTYDQVRGVKACAVSTCAAACSYEVQTAVWSSAVCTGELVDGGVMPAGPTVEDCPADGSAGADGAADGRGGGAPSGCGCGVVNAAPANAGGVGLLTLVALALALRRRASRLRGPASPRRPRLPPRPRFSVGDRLDSPGSAV
jgi:hypothetical protein